MLELYKVNAPWRREILNRVEASAQPMDADALQSVTSHTFRKTTATILDAAGLSARQIADQLGHARPSMTQTSTWDAGRATPPQRQRWSERWTHLRRKA